MKKALLIVLTLALVGGVVAYYQWNKPRTKVEDVQGLTVDAVQLCKDFTANEAEATAKYSGKVLEISGMVTEVQNNGKNIVLKGPDETLSVQCNMRDSAATVEVNKTAKIKGFFADYSMFGPTLTDCVIND